VPQAGKPAWKELQEPPRLVEDMVDARLLSVETEMNGTETVETVDLIHESLITGWDLLEKAIEERRDQLRRRVRFEQTLAEWMDPKNDKKELLRGVRLEEARELREGGDIALSREEAREFLRLSEEEAEAERRGDLERERDRIRAVAVSEHLRKELRGLVGGAAGFALAFLATYWQQAVDRSLLLFVTLVHTLPRLSPGCCSSYSSTRLLRHQKSRIGAADCRPGWARWPSPGLLFKALLFRSWTRSVVAGGSEGGLWAL
jgi:hypothetical protein